MASLMAGALSARANTASCSTLLAASATPAAAAAAPLTTCRVALRFTRLGRKKVPFYRLVAIDSKDRRDGEPIEFLGWYNPINKETSLDAPAIKAWLQKGAQPSETVGFMLQKALIMDKAPPRQPPRKKTPPPAPKPKAADAAAPAAVAAPATAAAAAAAPAEKEVKPAAKEAAPAKVDEAKPAKVVEAKAEAKPEAAKA